MLLFFNYLSVLSLIMAVTNFVPFSLAPVVTLLLVPYWVATRKYVTRIQGVIIILFLYVVISTLFYLPSSFFDFDFYRRDGNFFLTYSLLIGLLFSPFIAKFDFCINVALYVSAFISLLAIFLAPRPMGEFHFLFESHNAAGGYYCVMSSIAYGRFIKNRNVWNLTPLLIFVICLLLSDSRGSILAFAVAVIYSFFKFRRPLLVLSIFIGAQILLVSCTYPVWTSQGKVISTSINSTNSAVSNEDAVDREGTMIDRAYYLWPRAVDNFLHSPIFGLGFGSFDDLEYNYIPIFPNLIELKQSGFTQHTNAHAHNSYLNILAELGLVGFTLFVGLFFEIGKQIKRMFNIDRSVWLSLNVAMWACIFSSATEHRLTTPSQMVPFFIFFAISYSSLLRRDKLKERDFNETSK